jgi:hypothetical protein
VNTSDLVERYRRVHLICHAIRHLLDHCPEEMNCGDVEAIDILQLAINASESNFGSSGHMVGQFAGMEPAPAHHGDSLE